MSHTLTHKGIFHLNSHTIRFYNNMILRCGLHDFRHIGKVEDEKDRSSTILSNFYNLIIEHNLSYKFVE